MLTKANSRATVHRPSYLDYVGVKQFAPDGTVLGERRFLGLYTTTAYKTSPRDIPLLRDKVERVLSHAAFPPDSHDAKGLIDILESLPRDLLVQIDADDLFEIAIGILGLGERQRVRLFVTADQLDRFVACTLCLPRDRFNTENRQRAGRILADAFSGDQVDWRLQLGGIADRPRRLRRAHPGRRARRPTTSPRSRRGSPSRPGPGPISCAPCSSPLTASRAGASCTPATGRPSRPATAPTAAPRRRSWTSTASRS